MNRVLRFFPLIAVTSGIAAYIYHNRTIEDLERRHHSDRAINYMEGWKKGFTIAKDDWTIKTEHYKELKELFEEGKYF